MLLSSKRVLCLVLFSGGIFACKKSTTPPVTPPVSSHVYFLGTTRDSLVYWENGMPKLIIRDTDVFSNSLFVSGNDVYVDGTIQGNGSLTTPKYWLNGAATTLSDTTGTAFTEGIFASGTDVYVGGSISYFKNSTVPYTTSAAPYPVYGTLAVYWKNGVSVALPTWYYIGESAGNGSNVYAAYVSGIFVSGSDVFVSGGSHQFRQGDSATYQFALYWKNGTPINLGQGLVDSTPRGYNVPYTTGIFVSGNDVYVSGYESMEYPVATTQALYWKNGMVTTLMSSSPGAFANSIYIDGPDVYVAGYENDNLISHATYWKNGLPTVVGNPAYPSVANGIAVHGGDVYVAGNETVGAAVYPTIWKNGVATHFGGGGNGIAIAVK
jgi:hypothetical protein